MKGKLIGVAMIFAAAWLIYTWAGMPERNALGMVVVMNEHKPLPTQAEIDAAKDSALRWKVFMWSIVLAFPVSIIGAFSYFIIIPILRDRGKIYPDENGKLPVLREEYTGKDGTKYVAYHDQNKSFTPGTMFTKNGTMRVDNVAEGDMRDHADYAVKLALAESLRNNGGKARGMTTAQANLMSGASHQKARALSAKADLAELKVKNYQQKALPAPTEEPVRHVITQDEAVRMSDKNGFIVGYTDDGQKCRIDIEASAHIALIGASRTGKTSSIGMKLIVDCIRHGDHVVILDGMHGKDLLIFKDYVEWHDSDGDTFRGQMEALHALFQQRVSTQNSTRIVIVMEEFNEIWDDLSDEDKAAVEPILKTFMRKARHANMHMIVIGQEPMGWPKTLDNIKTKVVFSLGIREAAYVQENRAGELPDNGEFYCRRQRYKAWLWEAEYARYLPQKRGTPLGVVVKPETRRNPQKPAETRHETDGKLSGFSEVEAGFETEMAVKPARGGVTHKNRQNTPPPTVSVSEVSEIPEPLRIIWNKLGSFEALGKKYFEIFPNGKQIDLRKIMSALDGKPINSYKKSAFNIYHSYSPNGNNYSK